MRFFVSPNCGHYSKTEFVMGERVGSDTEYSLMQRFGKNLVESLNERRVRALLLDVATKPGVPQKDRFDQGPNAFILMCGLEKSPRRVPTTSVLTIRHSNVSKDVLDALVGPLNAWVRACASERPPSLAFESFRFASQSSVLQILPFRYADSLEVLFAQRLDALADALALVVEKFALRLSSEHPVPKQVAVPSNVVSFLSQV